MTVPSAPPRPCYKCGKGHTGAGTHCDDCRTPADNTKWASHASHKERVKKEPWSLWYRRMPWTNHDGTRGIRWVVLNNPKNAVCADPFSKGCHAPSTVADHKVPHKGNWHSFTDLKNLWGLCYACHAEKTVRERNGQYVPLRGINC